MRFPVVLFDLDGTLVDSGAMILASMRHATRTVLAREIPDDELLALVGSAALDEQMRVFDAQRADELVRCYREHNEPLHEQLACCGGMLSVVEALHAQRRRLGILTAKRRATVDLAFARVPLARFFDVVVTSEQTRRTKPDPEPILLALDRLGARAEDAAYVGDAPFDVAAAKAAHVFAVAVTWGGIHARERVEAEDPDAVVETAEDLLAVL